MTYELHRSTECSDEWIVGAVDDASEGEMYMAVFSGPGARERAEEYAQWKTDQGRHRDEPRRATA